MSQRHKINLQRSALPYVSFTNDQHVPLLSRGVPASAEAGMDDDAMTDSAAHTVNPVHVNPLYPSSKRHHSNKKSSHNGNNIAIPFAHPADQAHRHSSRQYSSPTTDAYAGHTASQGGGAAVAQRQRNIYMNEDAGQAYDKGQHRSAQSRRLSFQLPRKLRSRWWGMLWVQKRLRRLWSMVRLRIENGMMYIVMLVIVSALAFVLFIIDIALIVEQSTFYFNRRTVNIIVDVVMSISVACIKSEETGISKPLAIPDKLKSISERFNRLPSQTHRRQMDNLLGMIEQSLNAGQCDASLIDLSELLALISSVVQFNSNSQSSVFMTFAKGWVFALQQLRSDAMLNTTINSVITSGQALTGLSTNLMCSSALVQYAKVFFTDSIINTLQCPATVYDVVLNNTPIHIGDAASMSLPFLGIYETTNSLWKYQTHVMQTSKQYIIHLVLLGVILVFCAGSMYIVLYFVRAVRNAVHEHNLIERDFDVKDRKVSIKSEVLRALDYYCWKVGSFEEVNLEELFYCMFQREFYTHYGTQTRSRCKTLPPRRQEKNRTRTIRNPVGARGRDRRPDHVSYRDGTHTNAVDGLSHPLHGRYLHDNISDTFRTESISSVYSSSRDRNSQSGTIDSHRISKQGSEKRGTPMSINNHARSSRDNSNRRTSNSSSSSSDGDRECRNKSSNYCNALLTAATQRREALMRYMMEYDRMQGTTQILTYLHRIVHPILMLRPFIPDTMSQDFAYRPREDARLGPALSRVGECAVLQDGMLRDRVVYVFVSFRTFNTLDVLTLTTQQLVQIQAERRERMAAAARVSRQGRRAAGIGGRRAGQPGGQDACDGGGGAPMRERAGAVGSNIAYAALTESDPASGAAAATTTTTSQPTDQMDGANPAHRNTNGQRGMGTTTRDNATFDIGDVEDAMQTVGARLIEDEEMEWVAEQCAAHREACETARERLRRQRRANRGSRARSDEDSRRSSSSSNSSFFADHMSDEDEDGESSNNSSVVLLTDETTWAHGDKGSNPLNPASHTRRKVRGSAGVSSSLTAPYNAMPFPSSSSSSSLVPHRQTPPLSSLAVSVNYVITHARRAARRYGGEVVQLSSDGLLMQFREDPDRRDVSIFPREPMDLNSSACTAASAPGAAGAAPHSDTPSSAQHRPSAAASSSSSSSSSASSIVGDDETEPFGRGRARTARPAAERAVRAGYAITQDLDRCLYADESLYVAHDLLQCPVVVLSDDFCLRGRLQFHVSRHYTVLSQSIPLLFSLERIAAEYRAMLVVTEDVYAAVSAVTVARPFHYLNVGDLNSYCFHARAPSRGLSRGGASAGGGCLVSADGGDSAATAPGVVSSSASPSGMMANYSFTPMPSSAAESGGAAGSNSDAVSSGDNSSTGGSYAVAGEETLGRRGSTGEAAAGHSPFAATGSVYEVYSVRDGSDSSSSSSSLSSSSTSSCSPMGTRRSGTTHHANSSHSHHHQLDDYEERNSARHAHWQLVWNKYVHLLQQEYAVYSFRRLVRTMQQEENQQQQQQQQQNDKSPLSAPRSTPFSPDRLSIGLHRDALDSPTTSSGEAASLSAVDALFTTHSNSTSGHGWDSLASVRTDSFRMKEAFHTLRDAVNGCYADLMEYKEVYGVRKHEKRAFHKVVSDIAAMRRALGVRTDEVDDGLFDSR